LSPSTCTLIICGYYLSFLPTGNPRIAGFGLTAAEAVAIKRRCILRLRTRPDRGGNLPPYGLIGTLLEPFRELDGLALENRTGPLGEFSGGAGRYCCGMGQTAGARCALRFALASALGLRLPLARLGLVGTAGILTLGVPAF
jgi:hypothetical protein